MSLQRVARIQSKMGSILSRTPIISPRDKAILELKVQRDKLRKYSIKLELVISQELEIAKAQIQLKNNRLARLALSKKKYQESLLLKTENQLLTLEQLTSTIEYALVEKEIIEKLSLGNKVLKQIHNEMDLDKVNKIMDSTADGIAYQNEIEEAMRLELEPQDEHEIMAELDALMDKEREVQSLLDLKVADSIVTDIGVDTETKVIKKTEKKQAQLV